MQCEKAVDANASRVNRPSQSDEPAMVDIQNQAAKAEYSRSELLGLRHDQTSDLVEKAKNMKIAERIIQKNAAHKKVANANVSPAGAMGPANVGATAKETSSNEPNIDELPVKATTTPSNRNAANQNVDDPRIGFQLSDPWTKTGLDESTDFAFDNANAKVDNWLSAAQHEMPTRHRHFDDFSSIKFTEVPSQSNCCLANERQRTDTSSLVSDMSSHTTLRSQLLSKTAKLKQSLSKLKQQNN